jgi:hypothetical protein
MVDTPKVRPLHSWIAILLAVLAFPTDFGIGIYYLRLFVSCQAAGVSETLCALAGGRVLFFGDSRFRALYDLVFSAVLLAWFLYLWFLTDPNRKQHESTSLQGVRHLESAPPVDSTPEQPPDDAHIRTG